jgi:isoleucyl-tRNA synthetase
MNEAAKPTVYPPAEPSPSFPKLEEAVLRQWEAEKTFQKSIDRRREAGADEYVFL